MPPVEPATHTAIEFQSAPAGEGGRCGNVAVLSAAFVSFNPRPPVKAGGAGAGCPTVHNNVSFNPRPPVKAGGANAGPFCGLACGVSIRARR